MGNFISLIQAKIISTFSQLSLAKSLRSSSKRRSLEKILRVKGQSHQDVKTGHVRDQAWDFKTRRVINVIWNGSRLDS
jgi:hypothetical protein